jgi:hypothetical protein
VRINFLTEIPKSSGGIPEFVAEPSGSEAEPACRSLGSKQKLNAYPQTSFFKSGYRA